MFRENSTKGQNYSILIITLDYRLITVCLSFTGITKDKVVVVLTLHVEKWPLHISENAMLWSTKVRREEYASYVHIQEKKRIDHGKECFEATGLHQL